MAEGVAMLEWDQTSILWATLANAFRDEETHPRAFMPTDVHPLRQLNEADANAERAAIVDTIRSKQQRAKLAHGQQSNQSRGCVS